MLARPAGALPQPAALPGGCQYEPKWDGYRALLFRRSDGCHVQSRNGKDLTAAFPDIAAAGVEQLSVGEVLDGELVVWSGSKLDFTALQRRVISPTRAASLAAQAPASFLAFDLLADAEFDLRADPLARRRSQLERVLAESRPPLQLTPYTTDRSQAKEWMDDWAAAGVGIEGLVVKGRGQSYLPGRRDWVKVRIRDTAEALVGALVGTLDRPERVVLGLPSDQGLLVAGGTSPLNDAQRAELVPLLRAPVGPHPWPSEISRGRTGGFTGGKIAVTLVEPDVVIEISADTAFEHGKWRHLTQYVRARPDLDADDVPPREHG
jgi:ATP-dependent DNA ligase